MIACLISAETNIVSVFFLSNLLLLLLLLFPLFVYIGRMLDGPFSLDFRSVCWIRQLNVPIQ